METGAYASYAFNILKSVILSLPRCVAQARNMVYDCESLALWPSYIPTANALAACIEREMTLRPTLISCICPWNKLPSLLEAGRIDFAHQGKQCRKYQSADLPTHMKIRTQQGLSKFSLENWKAKISLYKFILSRIFEQNTVYQQQHEGI